MVLPRTVPDHRGSIDDVSSSRKGSTSRTIWCTSVLWVGSHHSNPCHPKHGKNGRGGKQVRNQDDPEERKDLQDDCGSREGTRRRVSEDCPRMDCQANNRGTAHVRAWNSNNCVLPTRVHRKGERATRGVPEVEGFEKGPAPMSNAYRCRRRRRGAVAPGRSMD